MTYISIAEGATIYQETYRSFYDKILHGIPFYPKKHNKQLVLEECLELHEQLEKFKANNISMTNASKILFKDESKLAGIYRVMREQKRLDDFFLPVTKKGKNLYFDKKSFNKFYQEKCLSSPLIKIGELKNRLDFGSECKFFMFIKQSDFYEKVQGVKITSSGYNFYPLVSVNAWLCSLGEKPIVLY